MDRGQGPGHEAAALPVAELADHVLGIGVAACVVAINHPGAGLSEGRRLRRLQIDEVFDWQVPFLRIWTRKLLLPRF